MDKASVLRMNYGNIDAAIASLKNGLQIYIRHRSNEKARSRAKLYIKIIRELNQ